MSKLDAYYAEIGRMVRAARVSKNMDAGMLAVITGVSTHRIISLEAGTLGPTGFFMQKIARALEVPLEDIFPDIEDLDAWLESRGL